MSPVYRRKLVARLDWHRVFNSALFIPMTHRASQFGGLSQQYHAKQHL